jgi:hypothetical protein
MTGSDDAAPAARGPPLGARAIVIISVAGDRAGEVFLGGHEEGCDGIWLVPLSVSDAGSSDLPGLFSMLRKGVAEEGGEVVTSL